MINQSVKGWSVAALAAGFFTCLLSVQLWGDNGHWEARIDAALERFDFAALERLDARKVVKNMDRALLSAVILAVSSQKLKQFQLEELAKYVKTYGIKFSNPDLAAVLKEYVKNSEGLDLSLLTTFLTLFLDGRSFNPAVQAAIDAFRQEEKKDPMVKSTLNTLRMHRDKYETWTDTARRVVWERGKREPLKT